MNLQVRLGGHGPVRKERMGYNVLETGMGSGTIEGFYALFGCLQPLGSLFLEVHG